jgi:uncharacterized protein (DUF885 family)
MVEEGVSSARALYAFNSTNVEGWALYSEYITLPFMPTEGQLVSLDYRLLRAARAFLDPELQAGTITQQQALDILMKDVVASHAFATQEVERYTLRAPGQANSYFYGFIKMISLRKDTEKAMGQNLINSISRFHPVAGNTAAGINQAGCHGRACTPGKIIDACFTLTKVVHRVCNSYTRLNMSC